MAEYKYLVIIECFNFKEIEEFVKRIEDECDDDKRMDLKDYSKKIVESQFYFAHAVNIPIKYKINGDDAIVNFILATPVMASARNEEAKSFVHRLVKHDEFKNIIGSDDGFFKFKTQLISKLIEEIKK